MSENVGRIRIAPELLLDWLDLPPGHKVSWAAIAGYRDGSVGEVELTVTGPSMPPAPPPGERAREVMPVYRRRAHELVEIRQP